MSGDAEASRIDNERLIFGRRLLLSGISLSTVGWLTGCMEIANWIADKALGDVNVFNETDRRIRGEIEIKGPGDSIVLSDSFDLEAQTEDEPNSEAMRAYEEIWGAAGEYQVDVQLDESFEVRGEASLETDVTIDDPEEQMLGIGLGIPDREDGIVTVVAAEWSGFADS